MEPRRPLSRSPWLLGFVVVVLLLVAVRAVLDIQRTMNEPAEAEAALAPPSLEPAIGNVTNSPPRATPPSISAEAIASLPKRQTIPVALKPLDAAAHVDASVNQVDPARLQPRLLKDSKDIAEYLAAFPSAQYEIAEVPSLGKFHVDAQPDYIKEHLRAGLVWEPEVEALLREFGRKGTTMIDAGAHIGTHTLTLGKIAGPNGRVYAFEPQKKIFRELHHNLRLNGANNVVALRFALGSEPGIIEMDETREGNEGNTAVGSGGDRAELRTIDSFGFDNVSLLKIDVEGFEDAVLEGARETIARSRPAIIIEVQGGHNFDNTTSEVRRKIYDTIRRVEDMGYWVVRATVYDYVGLPLLNPPVPDAGPG